MTDEELVAQAIAELAPLHTQQARAEQLLLKELPVAQAAAILREETLDELMSVPGSQPNPWFRYLRLEAAVADLKGWRPSLWGTLIGGDEPPQLRYARVTFNYDEFAKRSRG